MNFHIIDKVLPLDTFKTFMSDSAVMSVYLSLEVVPAREGSGPAITLRDQITIATEDSMIVCELVQGSWLLIFRIGKGSAAHIIALASVYGSVDKINDLKTEMAELFCFPVITINTERNIFVETDSSEPVGSSKSITVVPSSILSVIALPADEFRGSWTDSDEFKLKNTEDNVVIKTYIDAYKDPRDKTL